MKILIAPVEIAGYYSYLSDALKNKGLDADFILYKDNFFSYGRSDNNKYLVTKYIAKLKALKLKNQRMWDLQKILIHPIYLSFLVLFFIQCMFRYQVFIFGFGRSLLPFNIDLPILRLCGKKIIMNIGHGSEMRPPYCDGVYQGKGDNTRRLFSISRNLIKSMTSMEKYCNIIIGAPYSTSPFANLRMINFFALGLPFPAQNESSYKLHEATKNIRILHSPSNPLAKGTDSIRDAVQKLQARGHGIDYVELIGRPNHEVLYELETCDFVIDQIYSDTPMAGFATEAAWFSKPAVVGGYGLNELREHVPEGMFPPSQVCFPDKLESAIEQLIVDREYREKLGAEAKQFVRTKWTAEKLAERYIKLIEEDIPEEWWLDPRSVTYLHGGGQSEAVTIDSINRLVNTYGKGALFLSHRPDLEKAFLKFAGIRDI